MWVWVTRFAARASVQLRNATLAKCDSSHLTILGSRHTILLGFLGEDAKWAKISISCAAH
jgi:hypothetical protein